MNKILNDNYWVRRDIGNLLFHWTRSINGNSAFNILKKIIYEGELLGNDYLIRGGTKCVCFTESPITELASLFKLYSETDERKRFEPYGIAVRKEWLYSKGGRPVVYQSEQEYQQLPELLKWKHVRFEPNLSDFTWEREWRIKTDKLELDPKQTLLVVPSADEAFELMYNNADEEYDEYDEEGIPQKINHVPYWMAVSLDLFGIRMA